MYVHNLPLPDDASAPLNNGLVTRPSSRLTRLTLGRLMQWRNQNCVMGVFENVCFFLSMFLLFSFHSLPRGWRGGTRRLALFLMPFLVWSTCMDTNFSCLFWCGRHVWTPIFSPHQHPTNIFYRQFQTFAKPHSSSSASQSLFAFNVLYST